MRGVFGFLLLAWVAANAVPLFGLPLSSVLAAGALALGAFSVYFTGNRVSQAHLLHLGFMFAGVQVLWPDVPARPLDLAPLYVTATWAMGIGAVASIVHSLLVLYEAFRDRRR